jgi:hypothetical protein
VPRAAATAALYDAEADVHGAEEEEEEETISE